MTLLRHVAGAIGSGAALFNAATTLTILVGGLYLMDCRLQAKGQEAIDRCYFTALPMLGLGAVGRGGFSIGYQTFNPSLRRPDDPDGQARDAHGRFTRREGQ